MEQTSWILFLKYLDDFEKDKKTAAQLSGKRYTAIIGPEYRWDVWAMPKGKDGKLDHHKALNGDDLRDFVDHKLFPYLKKFKAPENAEAIEYKIGEIFIELKNKSLVIGSDLKSDVVVEGMFVAKKHAEIVMENNRVVLRHLRGLRRVSVSGKTVREVELKNNDEIKIAKDEFIYQE